MAYQRKDYKARDVLIPQTCCDYLSLMTGDEVKEIVISALKLTRSEQGNEYQRPEAQNPLTNIVWNQVRDSILENRDAYIARCEQNREAVKSKASAKADNGEKPTLSEVKQFAEELESKPFCALASAKAEEFFIFGESKHWKNSSGTPCNWKNSFQRCIATKQQFTLD